MIDIETLEKTTQDFFSKFCKEGMEVPKWSKKWKFIDEVPYNSYKGCYAHLHNDEITYIGLAISDSNSGSGLGSRISNYWRYDKSENGLRYYAPTVDGVDAIITLPFEKDNFYLAAALEVYLIQKLSPVKNRVHYKKK